MSLESIIKSVEKFANPSKAKVYQRFFKTGKGQYGEGDVFKGITNPQLRSIAKENKNISYEEISKLIKSKVHEERFIALVIMTLKFKQQQKKVYEFYLDHLDWVNNWDLVDISAYNIVGKYLLKKPSIERQILFQLAKSNHLWRKRVSIVSTYTLIKSDIFEPTLKISKILLTDKHDLIHKGVGWMLREMGKRDETLLQNFLQQNYDEIPRTCLRYAIQKFPEEKRKAYLQGQF